MTKDRIHVTLKEVIQITSLAPKPHNLIIPWFKLNTPRLRFRDLITTLQYIITDPPNRMFLYGKQICKEESSEDWQRRMKLAYITAYNLLHTKHKPLPE